jgi:hypothetical protein
LSAAFSKTMVETGFTKAADPVEGTIKSAIAGGIGSVLGGGKFANGAQTGAFSYLYNELMHQTSAYQRGYSDRPGDYRMYFDGRRLELYGPDGSLVDVFNGVSGAEGHQTGAFQALANLGPLTEGTWTLGQLQHSSNLDAFVGLAGKFVPPGKWGSWPGGTPAWGEHRVWLEPASGTNTFGRWGFSIHGGWFPGSAGCIDLGSDMRRFVDSVVRIKADATLFVKYR